MKKIFWVIKFIINILLYIFYSIISVIIWNFLYGAYLHQFTDKPVPWVYDFIHVKIAVFVCVLVLIFTLIFRNFFYLRIFKNKK